MRKNAVDKNIYPIAGGVCAPGGFRAGAARCGLKTSGENLEDLAVILADRVCPTAAVFTDNYIKGAPVTQSKKHLRNGEAKVILVNSGIALACNEQAEKITKNVCKYTAESLLIYPTEVILASTGSLSGKIDENLLKTGIKELPKYLSNDENGSISFAKAITTTDVNYKQGAFSFMLGDYPITIGYAAKGNVCVCPNMATTLCFLTTDVNISSKMLQKALTTQIRETLNMINVDAASSINDTVYLMSSCRAENAKIVSEDTDYEKFVFALRQVLTVVCEQIACDAGAYRCIKCNVEGAKSKQAARNIAKNCVGSILVKQAVSKKCINRAKLINLMGSADTGFNLSGVNIRLCDEKRKLMIFENGRAIAYSQTIAQEILSAKTVTILFQLKDGNYSAQAWGNLAQFERPIDKK